MQSIKWLTLIFAAVCLVVVAGVFNSHHLYYMAAILLTLPGVSYLIGMVMLRGLIFKRILPAQGWVGEEGEFRYLAENRSRFPRFFLTANELLPSWIEFVDLEPGMFNVSPMGSTEVVVPVRFLRRGVFQNTHFQMSALDPLGVFAFTRKAPCSGELVIYPTPRKIRILPSSGTDKYGFQDLISLIMHGNSVDPDGVRRYMPGDPLRRIHWRQTARTGKLSVIEFEETQAVNFIILLDTKKISGVRSGTDAAFECAVSVAASILQQVIDIGAGVRLLASEDKYSLSAISGRGRQHLHMLLDTLARVQPVSELRVSEKLSRETGYIQPATTLLIILTGYDPELPQVLAAYAAAGSKIAVLMIDSDGFRGVSPLGKNTNQKEIHSELLAVGAHIFLVKQRIENEIFLEEPVYEDS